MAASQLESRLAALVAPLREELALIETVVQSAEANLAALKEDRRRVLAVLRSLDAAKTGPKTPASTTHRSEAKGDRWLDAIRAHLAATDTGSEPREIIAKHIYEEMRATEPHPSSPSVKSGIEKLHDLHELRLLRKITGGAPVYVRTVREESHA